MTVIKNSVNIMSGAYSMIPFTNKLMLSDELDNFPSPIDATDPLY